MAAVSGSHRRAEWGLSHAPAGLQQVVFNFEKTKDSLSGPVAIVAVGAEVARSDVAGLFQFAAILNINLAIINILPLPVRAAASHHTAASRIKDAECMVCCVALWSFPSIPGRAGVLESAPGSCCSCVLIVNPQVPLWIKVRYKLLEFSTLQPRRHVHRWCLARHAALEATFLMCHDSAAA